MKTRASKTFVVLMLLPLLLASTRLRAEVTGVVTPPLPMHLASPLASPAPPYGLEDSGAWVKPTPLSLRLLTVLKHWPPPTLSLHDKRPEILRAIRTPGNSDLIGLVTHFEVKAPLARVLLVNDAIEDFPKTWENVVSVKVESRERNRLVTRWTRKAPAFFLPRIHYRNVTLVDKSDPRRIVYRHQLIDGNMVNSNDALVVIEPLGENLTRISILNFFDPALGPFRAIAGGKIWKKSLESAFKEDVEFRARVEHPEWNVDRISDEADHVLDRFPIDPVEFIDIKELISEGTP